MPDGYRDDNGFSYPEELQLEPDPPRGPVRWRWIAVSIAVVMIVMAYL